MATTVRPEVEREDRSPERRPPRFLRRTGHVVSLAVSAVFLYVAHRILEWEWPGFVTTEWDDVLPILTVSVVVTMIATVGFILYDPPWFRSVGSIVTSAFGLAFAVRLWQVFPFDFTGYDVDWTPLVRFVVGVAIFGTTIGILAETIKLVRSLVR